MEPTGVDASIDDDSDDAVILLLFQSCTLSIQPVCLLPPLRVTRSHVIFNLYYFVSKVGLFLSFIIKGTNGDGPVFLKVFRYTCSYRRYNNSNNKTTISFWCRLPSSYFLSALEPEYQIVKMIVLVLVACTSTSFKEEKSQLSLRE